MEKKAINKVVSEAAIFTKAWQSFKRRLQPIIRIFSPYQYSVARFVGTERQNSDYMIDFIRKNRIKPISYSSVLVEKRYIGILIYKHKKCDKPDADMGFTIKGQPIKF